MKGSIEVFVAVAVVGIMAVGALGGYRYAQIRLASATMTVEHRSIGESLPIWNVVMSDGTTKLVKADFMRVVECGFLRAQVGGASAGGFAAGTWEAFSLAKEGGAG